MSDPSEMQKILNVPSDSSAAMVQELMDENAKLKEDLLAASEPVSVTIRIEQDGRACEVAYCTLEPLTAKGALDLAGRLVACAKAVS